MRAVERAADTKEGLVAHMKVDICRTGINMPEKGLDVFDVGSAFKQMAGKTVAACMGRNRAGNTGKPGAFLKELVDAVRIKVSAGPGAWEKDTLRTAAFVPIFCKKVEIFLGQDGILIILMLESHCFKVSEPLVI